MTEGFLVVDKGTGVSSHDVVAAVRRLTGIRRSGHAGTLDPMATGVMVVALGRATRLVRYLQELPKEYEALAQLGVATDSLDADGSVVWRGPMDVGVEDIERVLPRFLGTIFQIPPMVSALKHEGRRLYELARAGTEVERAARPVTVYELELLDITPGPYPELRFRVVCGKGTYVRSLADDIARALGGRAHLIELRRLRVGTLTAKEARTVEVLEAEGWEGAVLTPAAGLRDLPEIRVDEETAEGVRHGVRFARSPAPHLPAEAPFRVLDAGGSLLAVYRGAGPSARAEVVLA